MSLLSSQKQHQAQIFPKENRIFTCESCNSTESSSWFLANVSQETKTINYQSSTQYLHSSNHLNVILSSNQQQQSQISSEQQQFQPARMCFDCWNYWKKYASFKYITNKGGKIDLK